MTSTQTLIIDQSGNIVESTDAIFKAVQLSFKTTTEIFPILETYIPVLFNEHKFENIIHIPAIEFVKTILPKGIYDFYFIPIFYKNQRMIEWLIEDKTPFYQQKRNTQQHYQEQEIKTQTIEHTA